MIVRAIAIVTLVLLALLVGAAPAMLGASHYAQLLRREHVMNVDAWGAERAWKVLAESLERPIKLTVPDLLMAPPAAKPQQAGGRGQGAEAIDGAFGRLLGATGKAGAGGTGKPIGDLGSDYIRSVEVMLTLAGYRAAMMMSALPFLFVFGFAAVYDGVVDRGIRGRSFILHDPEIFAASWVTALLVGCISVVALFLPAALTPWLLPALPLLMVLLLNRAIANYRL